MSSTKPIAEQPQQPSTTNERLMMNLGIKGGIGLVSAGVISLLVARKSCSRMFVTGMGSGLGLGYAWCQNDVFLKDPKAIELPKDFQSEFDRAWKKASSYVPEFAKFK